MNWISVTEQVPSHKEPIVYCIQKDEGRWRVGIAYWTVSKKWNPDIYSEKYREGFTHWLPLPSPPDKKSSKVETNLQDKLHKIVTWIDAYPLDIFPEPDFKKAAQVLKQNGITLDAISASNMRHVLNGIKDIIENG